MAAFHYKRLFRLRFTRTEPADVDDEFQFHLGMRARELEAQGHTPERARDIALHQFGDMDEARHYCRAEDERRMRRFRRTLWVGNLVQDVTFAMRTLRRQPAFALSTVLTLGIAIALAASAYGVLHAYLVRPLPYPDADRLVFVRPAPTRDPFPNMPSFDGVDWRVADSVFSDVVMWDLDAFTVAGVDRTESVRGSWASPGYFSALGMRPALGRAFEQNDFASDAPVAILSDALWSRLYNRDPSVVGRTVRMQSLDNPREVDVVTIVGIMAADAWHVNRFTDVLRPLSLTPRFPPMARLKPGMSLEEAEQRLNAVVLPQLGTIDPGYRLSLANVQSEYTHRIRPTLIALVSGALFLLLIAGASVAGAQAARAASRVAEVQVRLALGATRARIVVQLLTESLVVAASAAILGAVIAAVVLSSFGTTVGAELGASIPGGTDQLALGAGTFSLVIGIGAAIGVVFGLLPVFVVMRSVSASAGAGASSGSKGALRSSASPVLRRSLMVGQVAVTMMLLMGAGLMARTVLTIATMPLGFDDEHVVKGDLFLPPTKYRNVDEQRIGVERLLSALGTANGVRAVAMAFPDPLRNFTIANVRVMADVRVSSDSGPLAAQSIVTPEYFSVLDIQVKAGRSFGPQDDGRAPPVVILSEALARTLWANESAIGRQVRIGTDSVWRSVVGVVDEVKLPVESAPTPEVYVPFAQDPLPLLFVVAGVTGDARDAATTLQRAVTSVDNELALADVRALSELVDGVARRHRALATVLSLFGTLALGLAMLGLYASLAYVVAQRRREIAIRLAVGASPWAIRGLVAREGFVVVAGGLALGVVLSLMLTRLIASQLYGVAPTDPGTFIVIVTTVGMSALLAALAPLTQAARVQPAEIMRSE